MRGRRGKKYSLPGANWDSCGCRAGSAQLDGSPCSLALGARAACLQAVGATMGSWLSVNLLCFMQQSSLLSALHFPMPTSLRNF